MIKVFIVDDEEIIREGIRNYIERTPDCTCAGEAADGEMALPMLQELRADVLITDVRMPFLDGLELSAIVRRIMPWMHIIILSGHDEFEYAQQAISLGVEAYILKPVDSQKLQDALDGVRRRIDKERQAYADIEKQRHRDNAEQDILREHFLTQLVTGGAGAGKAVEQAAALGLDLVARKYVACRAVLTGMDEARAAQARAIGENLFGKRGDVIWFLKGSDRFVYLVKGEFENVVQEAAYEAAQQLQHELAAYLSMDVPVYIGSIVDRVSALPQSYEDARSLMYGPFGPRGSKILGYADAQTGRISPRFDFSSKMPLKEQLRHAAPADIPQLLDAHFGAADGEDHQSALYRYYLLMDLTVTAGRLAEELGSAPGELIGALGDPEATLRAASDQKSARDCAARLLERLFLLRRGADVRYGSEIRRAREYIAAHYGDASISLHSVAEAVGFSPNHFSAVFSQETGQTFVEYLTHCRIDAACRALTDTGRKLADIAYDIGYSEPHYFSYIFKKHTGRTPTEYRASGPRP